MLYVPGPTEMLLQCLWVMQDRNELQVNGAITYIYTKKNGLYFVINTKVEEKWSIEE